MKKFVIFMLSALMLSVSMPVSAIIPTVAVSENTNVEHLNLPRKLAKKTPTDIINNGKDRITVVPYNTLQVAFAQDFSSKDALLGDIVPFIVKNDIRTKEGTLVLPEATTIIAEVSNVERPKSFNRSGKVYLDFKYIELPDGTQIPVQARLFNKKGFLSRGKLNGLGKGLGTTLAGSAIGTGAGCGIGVAAGAVIIGGFAIGLPVGFALGGAAGLLTPGLYYKAKTGDTVDIQLTGQVNIEKL